MIITRSRLRRMALLTATVLLAAVGVAPAQPADSTLAFTFAYAPKTSPAELAQGYKKHLEWHSARNDPILWYGWFVMSGERVGHFVDGAYDVTGAEFDARLDPAGDANDARTHFRPVAIPQYRRVFRLRRDLGTDSFLEEHRPSALMQVVYYRVTPGAQPVFESAASKIADAARAEDIAFAMYEMLTGADGAMYAMYVPLTGFASFDNPHTSLELISQGVLPERAWRTTMEDLSKAIASTTAEVWQYRADLSLIPAE